MWGPARVALPPMWSPERVREVLAPGDLGGRGRGVLHNHAASAGLTAPPPLLTEPSLMIPTTRGAFALF